jgi:uncharacterized protein DUF6502
VNSVKASLEAALLTLLVPLVRLLLKAGIGHGDFASLAKRAYVQVARDEGRHQHGEIRPNVSRIAVRTGLTRADVTARLADETQGSGTDYGRQRAERVLSGWWADPDFQDEQGAPARLPIRGSRRSFAALVRRYSGESIVGSILDELLRVGAVKRTADERVEARSRTYAMVRWNPHGLEELGIQLAEHAQTLIQNLEHPEQPRLVRRVINLQLDPKYLPVLLRDLQDQANGFADSMDDAINHPLHTLTASSTEQRAMQLGFTVYVVAEPTTIEAATKRRTRRKKG